MPNIPEAISAMSFDDIRRYVQEALTARLVPPERTPVDAPAAPYYPHPWIVEIGTQSVIFELGERRFSASYSIDVAGNVQIGEVSEVEQAYITPNGQILKLAEGQPCHVFSGVLGDGEAADDGDNLIWKEILHPGRWFKTDSGQEIEVSADIVDGVVRSFGAGLPRYVSVPTDSHHITTRGVVPVEANRGFVKKLKVIDGALYAGFQFTSKPVAEGVRDGSIADCSVYLQPGVIHPETGEPYDWVLRHVLLTNNPLVQDLRPWNDIPADAQGELQAFVLYAQTHASSPTHTESNAMSENTGTEHTVLNHADEIILTGDARQEYTEFVGLGISLDEIKALAAQRDEIERQTRALHEAARTLRISQVVRALEGLETVEGVVALEGYRHYPVVIQAVEAALKTPTEGLALAADAQGVSGIDALVLGLVNAIPADGRIKLEQPAGSKQPPAAPALDANGKKQVTDEDADKLIAALGV